MLIIEDVQGCSIKAFLSFIYTDDIDQDEEVIDAELIYLADKYEVPGLIEFIFKRLPYMDDEVVVDCLVASDRHEVRHEVKELKQQLLKKIGCQKEKFVNNEYFRAQMVKFAPHLLLDIIAL